LSLPSPSCVSVMAKVPDGSAVVFILGEIDCREGILVAVEKLRYETPEEGVEHTVRIFIKVRGLNNWIPLANVPNSTAKQTCK